jgi:uncharacterized protein (DUF2062 family)
MGEITMSHTPDPSDLPSGQESLPATPGKSGVLSSFRCRLEQVATIDGSPRRTAAALALGVFLSFSPFLGFQILLGLTTAFALRLSRIAVLIGLCANLPWIMVPWYAATTAAAAALFGTSSGLDTRTRLAEVLEVSMYQPAFWGRTGDLAATFLWPFLIGPTLGAMALGLVAYVVVLRFLSRCQERRPVTSASPSAGFPGDAQERASDRHVHDAQRARLQP